MKKSVKIGYYIIIIIVIILGFVLGTKTVDNKGGYEYTNYSEKKYNSYTDSYYYPSTEVGDHNIEKIFGWYSFDYVRDTDYYEGNVKIPRKTLQGAENYQQRYKYVNSDYNFHSVNKENIIISIVFMILMLVIPFIIDFFLKKNKKAKKNKQFKEIKKLKEKLDLEMITKEEYEIEKAKLMGR